MMTTEQKRLFATWIGEKWDDDPAVKKWVDFYADRIDETLDPFARYDGSHWCECQSVTDDKLTDGTPVRWCEGVQALKGQQRVDIFVADFGDIRGVYQI